MTGSNQPQKGGDNSDADFSLFSLDGSEELYIAVAAVDDSAVTPEGVNAASPATQRRSLSEDVKATTKTVEFALTPAVTTVTVAAGQSATLAFKVSSTIAPFPDPVFLFDDCGLDDLLPPDSGTGALKVYLPLVTKAGGVTAATPTAPILCAESDGFVITFDNDFVTPTAAGVIVTMTIKTATVSDVRLNDHCCWSGVSLSHTARALYRLPSGNLDGHTGARLGLQRLERWRQRHNHSADGDDGWQQNHHRHLYRAICSGKPTLPATNRVYTDLMINMEYHRESVGFTNLPP